MINIDLTVGPMPKPKKGMAVLVLLRQTTWVTVTAEFGTWVGEWGGRRRKIIPIEVSGWLLLEGAEE